MKLPEMRIKYDADIDKLIEQSGLQGALDVHRAVLAQAMQKWPGQSLIQWFDPATMSWRIGPWWMANKEST